MNDTNVPDHTPSNSNPTTAEEVTFPEKKAFNRRSFLKNSVVAGAAVTAGSAILGNVPSVLAQETHGHLTRGDAAILRWLAAAEIIESDLWLQYQELAGTQDDEVSTIASRQIPGYPASPTGGSSPYTEALSQLDEDMRNTFTTTPKMN